MAEKDGKNLYEPQDLTLNQTSEGVPPTESEHEAKLGLSMLGKVALSVVIMVSLVISISCLMKFNQLEQERKSLEEELRKYNEAIGELQNIINSPLDDEYIIEQAKEKLGYYFPDENIYHQD